MPEVQEGEPFHSCILDEEVVGLSSDSPPSHEDVVRIIVILEDAGVSCCFIEEYALIYYGSGGKQNVGIEACGKPDFKVILLILP